MNTPMIGTRKNPTTANTAPSSSVDAGTPEPLSRLPGTAYFTTVPPASSASATPAHTHAVAPRVSIAQSTMAPPTSSDPGSSGTTTPTTPTRITMPRTSSVKVTSPACQTVAQTQRGPGDCRGLDVRREP